MLDLYVKLGKPSKCATCHKPIRIGQRTFTDGQHDFDTCNCVGRYEDERADRS